MAAPKRSKPQGTSESELIAWAAEVLGVEESALILTGIETQTDLSLSVAEGKTTGWRHHRLRLVGSHHASWAADSPAATLKVMIHENRSGGRAVARADLYSGEDGAIALPRTDPAAIAEVTDRRLRAIEEGKDKRRR